jgi:RNA polymerase sigma factor (sigma-70 family)
MGPDPIHAPIVGLSTDAPARPARNREPLRTVSATTCMTDAEAMAALARGEVAALDDLVVRYNERAQRIAYGVLRETSRTHDVVADAFLAVLGAAASFDTSRPFAPWFDRIVVNRAIKEAQREQRRQRLAVFLKRPTESEDPAHLAELGELRETLVLAFAQLHPRDRAVVTMRLVLGASEGETATALGCPVGTVKSRLARSRKQLHRHLAAAGVSGPRATSLGEAP